MPRMEPAMSSGLRAAQAVFRLPVSTEKEDGVFGLAWVHGEGQQFRVLQWKAKNSQHTWFFAFPNWCLAKCCFLGA